MSSNNIYGHIDGPLVIVGFGSIGRGFLPLIERHILFNRDSFHIIDPLPVSDTCNKVKGLQYHQIALNKQNYIEVLGGIFRKNKRGFCINLSVDTDSLDLMTFCRSIGVLYIDTVVEPWKGYYDEVKEDRSAQTNYALRQRVRDEKAANPGGTTAVSCCGANPGMVSWFVKEALLNLAGDFGLDRKTPTTRNDWAYLMRDIGIKGIHIAERDTQVATMAKPPNKFVNTWSVDGFLSESFQPAELGWGTHEVNFPDAAKKHSQGCLSAIYLEKPGALTKVHTWCPTLGPQYGYLVTHNEAISISDYFTIGDKKNPSYRPTCHYAYHPPNDAVLSLHECFGMQGIQDKKHILSEDEIESGIDELGVLLYGHESNAYWYGSRLSIEETRSLAPSQNATGLQVTSAVLAGLVWALENPDAGIVETEEMDHKRCLEIQRGYLGPVEGHYTSWTPLTSRESLFGGQVTAEDPWQFTNILAVS